MAASSTNTGNFLFTIFEVVMMLAASLVNRDTKNKFKAAINNMNLSSAHYGTGNYGVICLIDDDGDPDTQAKLLKVTTGSTSLSSYTNLTDSDWDRTFETPIDWSTYKGKDALFIGLTDNAQVYYIRHIDDAFIQATNGVSMMQALMTSNYIESVSRYGTEDKTYTSCNVPRIEQFEVNPNGYFELTGFWNPWVTEVPPVTPNFHNRYCLACSTTVEESGPFYMIFGQQEPDMSRAVPPTLVLNHMSETPSSGKEKGIAFEGADLYYKITKVGGEAHVDLSSASEVGDIVVNEGPLYFSSFWVGSDGAVRYGSQIVLDGVTTTDDRDVKLKSLPYSGDVVYTSVEIQP